MVRWSPGIHGAANVGGFFRLVHFDFFVLREEFLFARVFCNNGAVKVGSIGVIAIK